MPKSPLLHQVSHMTISLTVIYYTFTEEPFASDLPQGVKRLSPSSTPPASQWTATFPSNTTTQPTHTNTTTQPTHTNPTTISPTSSSVSSPGSRAAPVNFEFKPITADMVRK